jgi:hypothetical protein
MGTANNALRPMGKEEVVLECDQKIGRMVLRVRSGGSECAPPGRKGVSASTL